MQTILKSEITLFREKYYLKNHDDTQREILSHPGDGLDHLHLHVQGATQPHHLWLEEPQMLLLKY